MTRTFITLNWLGEDPRARQLSRCDSNNNDMFLARKQGRQHPLMCCNNYEIVLTFTTWRYEECMCNSFRFIWTVHKLTSASNFQNIYMRQTRIVHWSLLYYFIKCERFVLLKQQKHFCQFVLHTTYLSRKSGSISISKLTNWLWRSFILILTRLEVCENFGTDTRRTLWPLISTFLLAYSFMLPAMKMSGRAARMWGSVSV